MIIATLGMATGITLVAVGSIAFVTLFVKAMRM